jgi:hypothetical protein
MAHIIGSNDSEQLDVHLFFPGDRFPVIVGPTLRNTGWRGGIFVQYVPAADDYTVELSDGNNVAGFILFQSENYDISYQNGGFAGGDGVGSHANFLAHQPATGVGGQNVVTMITGGTRAFFKVFETRRLVAGARTGATIAYNLHDDLKISENGLLTNDSDGDLATVGVVTPHVVGIVSAVPAPRNQNRLGIDYRY